MKMESNSFSSSSSITVDSMNLSLVYQSKKVVSDIDEYFLLTFLIKQKDVLSLFFFFAAL